MKMLKKLAVFIVVAAIASMMSSTVFAAANRPYVDVTKSGVGKNAYKAICYVKKHHGYDGVVSGKRLHPSDPTLRLKMLIMTVNFYDIENVPITATDLKKANKPITYKWLWNKLDLVAKRLGVTIDKPNATNHIVSMDGAAEILWKFARMNKKLRPKR
ncbi:hypothetical protein J5491_02995 [Candidatus Saccharibacteria bacterium]|nr:hypothetical protein [Candidatus Saccharibacteria bacterium]